MSGRVDRAGGPRPGRPAHRFSRLEVLGLGAATVVGLAGLPPFPGAAGTQTAEEAAQELAQARLAQMTLQEKVGQLFMPFVYGAYADDRSAGAVAENNRLYGVATAGEVVAKYVPGGVIYFAWAGNMSSVRQVAALSNGLQRVAVRQRSAVPLLVSTDQEGGVVVRLPEGATQVPGAMALGAGRDSSAARTVAAVTGRELRAVGVGQNFAPVADVNVNPRNPVIGVRSFGAEAALVSEMVAAQVLGLQGDAGVSATAKHFPGHGDTSVDSHTGLPVIRRSRAQLEAVDLPPFEAAIAAGVDAIMTAHIVVPALDGSGRPATLSKPTLTGLLRDELGFGGLIVTDSLAMEGVRRAFPDERVPAEAIKAGADLMLMPPKMDAAVNGVLGAVRGGEIPLSRLDESVYRVLLLKARRGLFADPYVDEAAAPSLVGATGNWAASHAATNKTVTLVRNAARTLPLRRDYRDRVLITGAGGVAGSQAEGGASGTLSSLATELRKRGKTASVYETGGAPTDAQVAVAVARAQRNDLVVVATNRALASAGQQRLVQALLDRAHRPLVVVATHDPYDINRFPASRTYLAAYGYRPAQMAAVARVLFGEVNPSGKLPVAIPTADGSGTLHPYGHGLAYR